uniref:hypothetical protein n=1 Tax=Nocardia farcinica TaxID=37329 RepID=UPI002455A2C5
MLAVLHELALAGQAPALAAAFAAGGGGRGGGAPEGPPGGAGAPGGGAAPGPPGGGGGALHPRGARAQLGVLRGVRGPGAAPRREG